MADLLTLYLPDVPDEEGVVWTLGPQLDAAWFPEYHQWTVEIGNAVVYLYLDPGHLDRMEPDERQALDARLGFTPRTAFLVDTRFNNPESGALAALVVHTLHRVYGGRVEADADAEPAVTG